VGSTSILVAVSVFCRLFKSKLVYQYGI
jgi:hypothetical protein